MPGINDLSSDKLSQLALTSPLTQVVTLAKESPRLQQLYRSEEFWEKRIEKDFPSYVPSSLPISYREYYNMLSKVWNFYPQRGNSGLEPYLIEPIDLNLQTDTMSFVYPVPVFVLDGLRWSSDIYASMQKEGVIVTFIPRVSLLGPIPDVTNIVPKLNPKKLRGDMKQMYGPIQTVYSVRGATIFCLEHQHWPTFLAEIKNMGYVRFIGNFLRDTLYLELLEALENNELFRDPKISEEDFAKTLIPYTYLEFMPGQTKAGFSYLQFGKLLYETHGLTNKLGGALMEYIDTSQLVYYDWYTEEALIYPVPTFNIERDKRWLADIYTERRGSNYLIGFRDRTTMIGQIPPIENLIPNPIPVKDKTMASLGYDKVFTIKEKHYSSFLSNADKEGYFAFHTGNEQEPFAYLLDREEIKDHAQLFNVKQ